MNFYFLDYDAERKMLFLFLSLSVFYTDMFRRGLGFLTGERYIPLLSNLGNSKGHILNIFYTCVYLLASSYSSSLGNSICTESLSAARIIPLLQSKAFAMFKKLWHQSDFMTSHAKCDRESRAADTTLHRDLIKHLLKLISSYLLLLAFNPTEYLIFRVRNFSYILQKTEN